MRCLLLPFALAFGLLASASPALAESPTVLLTDDWLLTIDGQYRPRVLFSTGGDFLASDSPHRQTVTHRELVTQRARLGLTLDQPSGLAFTIRVQDVRIWGEEASTVNDYSADGFDVHEVFVVVPLIEALQLKVGRQEIVIENARLVGNVGWTQRARSFDGGRLMFKHGSFGADVFYAKIREAEQNLDGHVPDGVEDDIDFGGIHTEVGFAEGHKLASMYLVNLNHGFNDAGDENLRHTAGLLLDGKVEGFSYGAEGYYQFGRIVESQITAYMVGARVGYEAQVPAKPNITLWGELLSGDGTPDGAFDTLYATNHKYYGEMDFFINIPVDTANLGLVDLGGRLGASATEDLKFHVDGHHLRSVESDARGNQIFGNELDFKVQYAAMKHLALRALYGVFFPSNAIRAPNKYDPDVKVSPEHFAYLTMDLKF